MAKKPAEVRFCRDCISCKPVTEPDKLSLRGEPILGRCPNWTLSRSFLLSTQTACNAYNTNKQNDTQE